jgi:hypothetical protein
MAESCSLSKVFGRKSSKCRSKESSQETISSQGMENGRGPCCTPCHACAKLWSSASYDGGLVSIRFTLTLRFDLASRNKLQLRLPYGAKKSRSLFDLPNFLLCPLKIAAHLMGISHTLLEALTSLRKTSLRLLLKLHKLAVLGIHFTRSAHKPSQYTYWPNVFCRLRQACVTLCKYRRTNIVCVASVEIGWEIHLRLSLHGHTTVKGDWVKRVGKAVLHVLLEVNAASRASAFIFAVSARILVPGRGSRVSTIAVGGDARGGANRVITFRRRDGILAVGGVLGALGGNGKRHGVAHRSVMRRHGDYLIEKKMCVCQLNTSTSDPSDGSRLSRLRTSEDQLKYESRVSRQQAKKTMYKCWASWDFKSGAG